MSGYRCAGTGRLLLLPFVRVQGLNRNMGIIEVLDIFFPNVKLGFAVVLARSSLVGNLCMRVPVLLTLKVLHGDQDLNSNKMGVL